MTQITVTGLTLADIRRIGTVESLDELRDKIEAAGGQIEEAEEESEETAKPLTPD